MRLPHLPLVSAAALTLTACLAQGGNTAITGVEWHLVGLEGMRAPAPLTLLIDTDGKVSGQAPCNRWFATNTSDLPALSLTGIGATRMACPDLAVEQAYFEALAAMQRVETDQGHLFLIGAEGRVIEFAPTAGASCLSCGG